MCMGPFAAAYILARLAAADVDDFSAVRTKNRPLPQGPYL
jgi:hypothetical protein